MGSRIVRKPLLLNHTGTMVGPLVKVEGDCSIVVEGKVAVDVVLFNNEGNSSYQPLGPPWRFETEGKCSIGHVKGWLQAIRIGPPGTEVSVWVETK